MSSANTTYALQLAGVSGSDGHPVCNLLRASVPSEAMPRCAGRTLIFITLQAAMAVGRGLAVVMAAMVCLQAASAQVSRSRRERRSPAAISDHLDVFLCSYRRCSAFQILCTMLYFQTTSKRHRVFRVGANMSRCLPNV